METAHYLWGYVDPAPAAAGGHAAGRHGYGRRSRRRDHRAAEWSVGDQCGAARRVGTGPCGRDSYCGRVPAQTVKPIYRNENKDPRKQMLSRVFGAGGGI